MKLYSQKIRVEIHGEYVYFQKSYLMIFGILSVARIKWQKLLLWYGFNGVTNSPVRVWLKVSVELC